MKEQDFIKLYKKNRNLKNAEEAKKRIDNLWETLIEILHENEKITFKNWGRFEIKKYGPRKYSVPATSKIGYSEKRNIVKFKNGSNLRKSINESDK